VSAVEDEEPAAADAGEGDTAQPAPPPPGELPDDWLDPKPSDPAGR
jgi:hypothetical protein